MYHLRWHKPRLVTLGPKIEALPNNHPSKAECLECLSRLFRFVGNRAEQKRLLAHCLKLWREREDDDKVALTLRYLSEVNRLTGLPKEGVRQAKEASEICERLGKPVNQADCSICLAWALRDDEQLDAAEEAATRAIDLLPEQGPQSKVSVSHRALGNIYRSKGETEKAIHHLEIAFGVASSLNWPYELFWIHLSLARVYSGDGRFDDAHTHVQHAKSHAVNNPYLLAAASWLQARLWYKQHRPEQAKYEALQALDMFEKLGAANDAEGARIFLREIDTGGIGLPNGELPETVQTVVFINPSCSDIVTESDRL